MKPLLFVLIYACLTGTVVADVTSSEVRVTTISGSGASGVADGGRLSARYLMPFGVYAGESGRIYVTDAAAQRVRVIEPGGFVRTLAGGGQPIANGLWVRGAFRNGAGSKARFDHPAGIVARDSVVYVADTNNRCIRRIDASGNVSTYAGVPGVEGGSDGPRLSATFTRPTSLSFDARGNLYVADYFGIRIISTEGDVKTIPNFSAGPFGVSVVDTKAGPVIFASDRLGVLRRAADGSVERFAVIEHLQLGNRNTQGNEPLGYPFGIAAFDDHSLVFTDPRSNTVRYLNWTAGSVQTLAGVDVGDGAASFGGFRDGMGDVSRFGAPLGVALAKGGAIIIADAASKRIREITGLDRSHDASPGGLPPKVDQGAYRIAFVGNSFLWEYQRWSDSIEGLVERRLTRAYPKEHIQVAPYVFPGSPFDGQRQYAEVLGTSGVANFVVLNLNPFMLNTASLPPDQLEEHFAVWGPPVTEALRRTYDSLRAVHVGFLVAVSPLGENISPSENLWNVLTAPNGGTSAPHLKLVEEMNAAVKAAGVPMLDVAKIFENESKSPLHAPLFGTQDVHFSRHGRAVMADAISRYLLTLRPWIDRSP